MSSTPATARPSGFAGVVTSQAELAELYPPVHPLAVTKETAVLDDGCRRFIAASTFVLVGTSDAAGHQDVSPRGGPAGFVHVLDDRRLAIPDLSGNNRLDSLRNIVDRPGIGLLFLVPGLGETLRVNGRAVVTTDAAVLDGFEELRRPRAAIGVTIDHAYIHCAKALRRGGLWQPGSWPQVGARPRVGQILVEHTGATGQVTGEQVEAELEEAYAAELAADRPAP